MDLKYPTDEQLRAVLAGRPRALLTDIDGTISPIAPTPEEARVDERCREALRRLAGRLELVGAISGRAASDAAKMVGLDQLLYIGNHGMELWEHGTATLIPEAQAFAGRIGQALDAVRDTLDIAGLRFEDKGITGSVHYRLAADPEQAKEQVRAALEPVVQHLGLVMTPGRMIWELRPPIEWDKGAAVERMVENQGLRAVVFLGDDTTDVHAFRRLARLRRAGTVEALIVGVMAEETPAEVYSESDVQVAGVEGSARLLERLVELARN